MNTNHSGDSSAEKLGERLAAEARAARPAFNAELHARLLAELPTVTLQPRKIVYAPFSMLRAAALVALMIGSGAVALYWSKDTAASPDFAHAVAVPDEPLVIDTQAAENSRRLLALARVKPMKMISRILSAPSETQPDPETETPGTIQTPQEGVAATDLFSIRLTSRAPFLNMQFNPQRALQAAEPQN